MEGAKGINKLWIMGDIKSIELGKLSKHQLVFLNRSDPEREKNKRGQLALNFSNITVQVVQYNRMEHAQSFFVY